MDRNIDRVLQDLNLGDNLTPERFSELLQIDQANIITLVISLTAGLLLCFLGLKLIKLWSGFAGLLVGALGGLAAGLLIGVSGITILIVVLFAGFLILVLSVMLRRLGIFWVCLFAGGTVGMVVMHINPLTGLIVALAAGLLAGIAGAIVKEPVVIIMTSIQGGIVSAMAVMGLIGIDNQLIGSAVGVFLLASGMVVQFVIKSREIGKKQSVWARSVKKEQSREAEVEAARSVFVSEDQDE